MEDVLKLLSQYPIKTRLSLTGTLVVARDIAHAKIKERLDSGEGMPQYMRDHPVYYAGPAKTPEVRENADFIPIAFKCGIQCEFYVRTLSILVGIRQWFIWTNNCWSDGFLCGTISSSWWQQSYVGEREQK